MDSVNGMKRPLSESTKALLRKRAKERGERRSDSVREHVLGAMQAMKEEIDKNNGVYPGNRLSAAEVARRAGIHTTTLFTEKQRELGEEVKKWLQDVAREQSTEVKNTRRDVASRVAEWKRMYDGLAQSHRDTELELQQAEAVLARTQAALEALRQENDGLRKQLKRSDDGPVLSLVKDTQHHPKTPKP